MKSIHVKEGELEIGQTLEFVLNVTSKERIQNALLRFVLFNQRGNAIGTSYPELHLIKVGENRIKYKFPTNSVMPGKYIVDTILCEFDGKKQIRHDIVTQAFGFTIKESEIYYNMNWNQFGWGNIKLRNIVVEEK